MNNRIPNFFEQKPPSHLTEKELARHPSWRRYTQKYRKKKKIVRDIWIVSGTIVMALPLGGQLLLLLTTTILAFTILDETP